MNRHFGSLDEFGIIRGKVHTDLSKQNSRIFKGFQGHRNSFSWP